MILGVVIPDEDVSWFAIRVTDMTFPPNTIKAPKRGQAMDDKGFRKTLDNALKDQGPIARDFVREFML